MNDKINLITDHFIEPNNCSIRRFKIRANRSWKIDDIKKHIEEKMKPELGFETTICPVIEIEEKQDHGLSVYYNFDNQFIEDYDPLGNNIGQETKKVVFLKITWSLCRSNGVQPTRSTSKMFKSLKHFSFY